VIREYRRRPSPRRSRTARALEIMRPRNSRRVNWAAWSLEVRSPRSNTSPDNATPRSGEPISPPSMAPGARSEAKGAETPAPGVMERPALINAPVTAPGDCGSVPFTPSTEPKS
jgi:hypothetical protein